MGFCNTYFNKACTNNGKSAGPDDLLSGDFKNGICVLCTSD